MPLMTPPNGGAAVEVPQAMMRQRIAEGWSLAQPIRQIVVRPNDQTGDITALEADLTPEAYQRLMEERGTQVLGLDERIGDLPAMEIVNAQRDQRRREAQADAIGPEGVFARNLAATLTFGGSEALAASLAEDPETFRAIFQAAEAANPGADFAGTLAGFALPGVGALGWGRSFLGAGGASLQAGRLARAGAARLGAGSTGQALAQGMIDGGVGGALYAYQVANETGDYENLSERMMADGMLGALFGGGLEGGVALLRRSAQGTLNAARAEQQALLQTAGTTTDPGTLRRIWGRIEEVVSGVNLDQTRLPRSGRSLRDPEALDAVARARQQGDDLLLQVQRGVEEARDMHIAALDQLGVSNQVMRNAMRNVPEASVTPAVAASRAAAQEVVNALELAPRLARGRGRALQQQAERLVNLGNKPVRKQVAQLVDIREELVKARRGLSVEDAELGAMYRQLQSTVDEQLTGLPGYGEFHSARIAVADSSSEMLSKLRRIFGGDDGTDISGANIKAALQKMARGESDVVAEALGAILSPAQIDDAVARGLLPNGFKKQFSQRITTKELQPILNDFEALAGYEKLLRQVNQESGLGATLGIGGGAGAVTGAVVGFAAGGVPGALLGVGTSLLAAALTKPLGFARATHSIRRLFRSQDTRLSAATVQVDNVIRGKARPGGYSALAPRAGSIGAIWLNGTDKERAEAYERVASSLENIQGNLEGFMAQWQSQIDGTQFLNDQLPSQMTQDAMRGLGTLAALLPAGRRGRNQMRLPTISIRPSRTEQDAFLEAAAVVEDPLFGVELMGQGVLSNQGARALESAYPRLYNQVVQQAFQSYVQMTAEGETPSYQAAASMSALTGIPFDSSLEPSNVMALQSMYAQTNAQERAVRSMDTVRREIGNLHLAHQTMGSRLQD